MRRRVASRGGEYPCERVGDGVLAQRENEKSQRSRLHERQTAPQLENVG